MRGHGTHRANCVTRRAGFAGRAASRVATPCKFGKIERSGVRHPRQQRVLSSWKSRAKSVFGRRGGTHHVVEIGILHGFHGFRGFLGEGSLDGLRDWGRSCGEGGAGGETVSVVWNRRLRSQAGESAPVGSRERNRSWNPRSVTLRDRHDDKSVTKRALLVYVAKRRRAYAQRAMQSTRPGRVGNHGNHNWRLSEGKDPEAGKGGSGNADPRTYLLGVHGFCLGGHRDVCDDRDGGVRGVLRACESDLALAETGRRTAIPHVQKRVNETLRGPIGFL